MDTRQYIESGILELYVAGILSEKETREVYHFAEIYPEIKEEILKIEQTVLKLTEATASGVTITPFESIKNKLSFDPLKKTIETEVKIIPINNQKSNWLLYAGWAASIILMGGIAWLTNQNTDLKTSLQTVEIQKGILQNDVEQANNSLLDAKNIITALRDKDIITVSLAGQAVKPEAYAKVYWNKKTNSMYLDLQGLPEPPEGKQYQIWSLTLNPLTPTSLGVVDGFIADADKIFTIQNTNQSEAFGITLEPKGGSVSPTMEQLYTLGMVAPAG